MEEEKKYTDLEAMTAYAEVLNDTPIPITIGGKEYYIRGLKMGAQALIAEESCKIQKHQEGNMVDIIKQFAVCVPSVVKCLAIAVLNDKDRIFKNYATREYSDEYQALVDTLTWESNPAEWLNILTKVIGRLDISFFFNGIERIAALRSLILSKRKRMTEPLSSTHKA